MSPADSLDVIAAEVRACTKCRLSQTRTHGVPGDGPANAEVFFIGEGPGFYEDQQGSPFVGAAGQLLNEMLGKIGLKRADVFITNVVRCRPPNNRDPQPDELRACDEYSVRQLRQLRPKVIVTLGRFSMARFFGPGGSMRALHGKTTTWHGIECIAMYHPAYILRDRSPAILRTYEEDFRKILDLLASAQQSGPSVEPPAEPTQTEPAPERLDQLRLL